MTAAKPYLVRMALIRPSSYWRHVNPRGAIADLRTVYREAGTNRWRFALAAGVVTLGIFSVMWNEGMRGPPRRPSITYITSWPAGRSDAEIIASNIANQKIQDRLAAEQAQRDEEVRNIYKKIGRLSGMDVEAIERKAAAERAAEAQARAARLQQQRNLQAAGVEAAKGPAAPAKTPAPAKALPASE